MRVRVIRLAAVLLVGVLAWQGWYWTRFLELACGYSAKVAASGVFIADRPLEQIQGEELAAFDILSLEVDRERRSVTASFAGLFERTAVHRPGLGASLVHAEEGRPLGPASQPLPAGSHDESEPWPAGVSVDPTGLDAAQLQALERALDRGFAETVPKPPRNTRAILVVHGGKLVAERYSEDTTRSTPLHGWSMTKTVTNLLFGILVADGRLQVSERAPIVEWSDDERSAITIEHLLRMQSGLDFLERYDEATADALHMLFGSDDMATYVACRTLRSEPGTEWSYSSGDSLLLSRILRDRVGAEQIFSFARDRLFAPTGMTSARLEFDASGTPVGSSMSWATGQDWARLGLFLMRDGVTDSGRILPEGWLEWSTTPTPTSESGAFGAHIWVNAGDGESRAFPRVPKDAFWAAGFEGQFVVVVPSRDTIVVRLGQTFGEPRYDIESLIVDVLAAIED